MKKKLLNSFRLRALAMIAVLCAGVSGAWGGTYSYTFSGKQFSSNTSVALGDVSWTLAGNGNYLGYDATKGQQFGSGSSPYKSLSLSTSAISGTITKIVINASGANSVIATISCTVGGKAFGTQAQNLSATATDYTFSGSASGDIVISMAQTSSKALYIKSIEVTFEGDAPVVETCATPTFSVESGVYTSARSVSIESTSGATIYYTTDGNNPTTSSSEYKSAITVSETMTIKAIAVKGGYNNSQVASATYAILQHAGTEADPYTIADARAAYEAGVGTTNVCVKGKVSEVSNFYETDGQLTYKLYDNTITDGNEFQVFKGKGLNGANFTSKEDLKWNDEVIVKGEIDKWSTTYEFKANSQIVSRVEYKEPIINPAVREITLEYNETEGSIEYSITNPKEDYELSAWASSEDTWIKNIAVTADKVTFQCDENDTEATRTTTISLSYSGATIVNVTVTQKHYGAGRANLPFTFDGGKNDIRDDIEATKGLTQEGFGTDYANSPKLKFDTTGDNLILHFNGRPGTLSFDIKGNGSPWEGTFKVQTSTDGETYTDLGTYTNLNSTTQSEKFKNLDEDVHYIKWIYAKRTSGNVALGNIKLAEYVPPQPYTLTIANPEHVRIMALVWSPVWGTVSNGQDKQCTEGSQVVLQFNIGDGYVLKTVTLTDDDDQTTTLTPNEDGNYAFEMPSYNVTVNAEVDQAVLYTLATKIISGKHYIITNASDKAMGVQNSNNRGVGDVAIKDGIATVFSSSPVCEFIIEGDETDGYTIYDETYPGSDEATGGYLYAPSSTANQLKTQTKNDNNGVWKITINSETGAASIVAKGSNTHKVMQYNNGSTLFSCYSSASQAPVYLYEKGTTITISESCYDKKTKMYYATYSNTNAFVVPEDLTVAKIDVYGSETKLLAVNPFNAGDIVPANTGVMVSASTPGEKSILLTTGGEKTNNNMLRPSGPNGITAEEMAEADLNCTYYRLTMHNGTDIGFWWGAEDGDAFQLSANKAYLAVPNTTGDIKGFAFSDIVDGIKAVETTETESNAIYNLAGQRVSKMQKGIYIVNGKKVLVK